jgi:sortase A
MILVGAVALAYAVTTTLWREPVSDLYTRWHQQELAREFDRAAAAYSQAPSTDATAARADTAAASTDATVRAGRATETAAATQDPSSTQDTTQPERKRPPALPRVEQGEPFARIAIPRIGLRTIVVEGTRATDLRKGPGHFEMTALPGAGKVVAIGGHRTTFSAPLRHIDELTSGDTITLSTVYGEFRYRVFAHEIVDKSDWSIIRPRKVETLVLSACHPLYSARQRWVVYARLVETDL